MAARGAQQLADGSLVVTDSTFEGNVEQYGGAIDFIRASRPTSRSPSRAARSWAIARSARASPAAARSASARHARGRELDLLGQLRRGAELRQRRRRDRRQRLRLDDAHARHDHRQPRRGPGPRRRHRRAAVRGPRGRSRSCRSRWSTRSWPATRPRSSRRSRAAAAVAMRADDCDFPVGTRRRQPRERDDLRLPRRGRQAEHRSEARGAGRQRRADAHARARRRLAGREHGRRRQVPGHRPARHGARRRRVRLRRLRARAPGHASRPRRPAAPWASKRATASACGASRSACGCRAARRSARRS